MRADESADGCALDVLGGESLRGMTKVVMTKNEIRTGNEAWSRIQRLRGEDPV